MVLELDLAANTVEDSSCSPARLRRRKPRGAGKLVHHTAGPAYDPIKQMQHRLVKTPIEQLMI